MTQHRGMINTEARFQTGRLLKRGLLWGTGLWLSFGMNSLVWSAEAFEERKEDSAATLRVAPERGRGGVSAAASTSLDLGAVQQEVRGLFQKGVYGPLKRRLMALQQQHPAHQELALLKDMTLVAMGEEKILSSKLQEHICLKRAQRDPIAAVAWGKWRVAEGKTPEDKKEGLDELISLATNEGSGPAAYLLAALYYNGVEGGGEEEKEKAYAYLDQAAEVHAASAFARAQQYYERETESPSYKEAVLRYLALAAQLGHPEAQYNLALRLLNNNSSEDRRQGRRFLQQSAQAGHIGANHNMGAIYLKNRKYYEALQSMTRAYLYAVAAHKGQASLRSFGEGNSSPSEDEPLSNIEERLKHLCKIYETFLAKQKPVKEFLPLGKTEAQDEKIINVLNVFLKSNAPLSARKALLMAVVKEVPRLTQPLKREIYAYLRAQNIEPAFKKDIYGALLQNGQALKEDEALGKQLWELYFTFLREEAPTEEDYEKAAQVALGRYWPLYRAEGTFDGKPSLPLFLLHKLATLRGAIDASLGPCVVSALAALPQGDWRTYNIAWALQNKITTQPERTREGEEVLHICRRLLVQQDQPFEALSSTEDKTSAKELLRRLTPLKARELGVLFINRLLALPPESPMRRGFLNTTLEAEEAQLVPQVERNLTTLTFILEPLAFPKLEEEVSETELLQGYMLNPVMVNDPRITVLNIQDFEGLEAVSEEAFEEAVARICNRYKALVSTGHITDNMRFEYALSDKEEETRVYLLSNEIQNLFSTPTGFPDGLKTEAERWHYFWSDEYKEERPSFWQEVEANGIDILGNEHWLRNLITNTGGEEKSEVYKSLFKAKVTALADFIAEMSDEQAAPLLGMWSCAGQHCSTRSDGEVGTLYSAYLKTKGGETKGIAESVAKLLEHERRRLLHAIVPDEEYEALHQRKHLSQRLFQQLGLYGDDLAFEDQFGFVVSPKYKDPSSPSYLDDEFLMKVIREEYTSERLITILYDQIKDNYDHYYQELNKEITSPPRKHELYETIEHIGDLMEMDEETYMPEFTKRTALSILVGLGYLIPKPKV